MQSVTAVDRGDQRELRARRERKDRNALGCISKPSGERIHSLSLIRHWVNARRTASDNNESAASALLRPAGGRVEAGPRGSEAERPGAPQAITDSQKEHLGTELLALLEEHGGNR
jgi:hypothetical protein